MTRHTDFRFVQKESPSKGDYFDICYTYVFFIRFNDIKTQKPCKLKYVIRAEIYGEVIAVKFYCSRDRKSQHDFYSLAHEQLNPSAVLTILNNCLKVINISIYQFPNCSFIFKGAEAYDPRSQKWENENNNQRFRIYKHFIGKKIGTSLFTHKIYEEQSIYMLIRHQNKITDSEKGDQLIDMMYSRFGLKDE